MSAHAHETSSVPMGPLTPEALEAAPKPWYDDLKIVPVFVAAFVSSVLSLASIFFVQGLYAQLTSAEINSKDRRILVSPGQAIINAQSEMLVSASAPKELTSKLDADRYYGELASVTLKRLDVAKQETLAAYDNAAAVSSDEASAAEPTGDSVPAEQTSEGAETPMESAQGDPTSGESSGGDGN